MNQDFFNCKTFGIIGAGMVGTALASYLSSRNQLGFIYARSPKRFENLINSGIPHYSIITDLDNMCRIPDCFIIAVNDTKITEVVEELKSTYGPILTGKYVFHTSGSKTFEEIKSLAQLSCNVFTAHPFQTFYVNNQNIFKNLIWGIEKGNTEENEIKEIIKELDGQCYFLTDENISQKELYHLTAVAASNFLISTIEFSKILFQESKLNNPEIVEQIINRSVQNATTYFDDNSIFPITGPLSRADEETIKKHLKTLSYSEELTDIYKHFSLATSAILLKRKMLTHEQYEKILKEFE